MKKALKIIGFGILFLFLSRGFLYRQSINYTPIKERKSIPLTNQKIISAIQVEIKDKQLNLSTIAHIATKVTNKHLQFTFQKVSDNPNQIAVIGKANCVGYSAMFSSIANYLISVAKLEKQLAVKHLVGELDFLGINLHQFFTGSFYQDHDYNIIEDKRTSTVILVDPSIDDYLWIGTKLNKTTTE